MSPKEKFEKKLKGKIKIIEKQLKENLMENKHYSKDGVELSHEFTTTITLFGRPFHIYLSKAVTSQENIWYVYVEDHIDAAKTVNFPKDYKLTKKDAFKIFKDTIFPMLNEDIKKIPTQVEESLIIYYETKYIIAVFKLLKTPFEIVMYPETREVGFDVWLIELKYRDPLDLPFTLDQRRVRILFGHMPSKEEAYKIFLDYLTRIA